MFVLSCVYMVEALQRPDTPRNESYRIAREKEKFENMKVQYRNPLQKNIGNKTLHVHSEHIDNSSFHFSFCLILRRINFSFPDIYLMLNVIFL